MLTGRPPLAGGRRRAEFGQMAASQISRFGRSLPGSSADFLQSPQSGLGRLHLVPLCYRISGVCPSVIEVSSTLGYHASPVLHILAHPLVRFIQTKVKKFIAIVSLSISGKPDIKSLFLDNFILIVLG